MPPSPLPVRQLRQQEDHLSFQVNAHCSCAPNDETASTENRRLQPKDIRTGKTVELFAPFLRQEKLNHWFKTCNGGFYLRMNKFARMYVWPPARDLNAVSMIANPAKAMGGGEVVKKTSV